MKTVQNKFEGTCFWVPCGTGVRILNNIEIRGSTSNLLKDGQRVTLVIEEGKIEHFLTCEVRSGFLLLIEKRAYWHAGGGQWIDAELPA